MKKRKEERERERRKSGRNLLKVAARVIIPRVASIRSLKSNLPGGARTRLSRIRPVRDARDGHATNASYVVLYPCLFCYVI